MGQATSRVLDRDGAARSGGGGAIRRGPSQTTVLLVALVALVLAGPWLSGSLDDQAFRTWCTMFVSIVVQAMPFLVLGVVLSAVVSVLLSQRILDAVMPRRTGAAVPLAGIAGVALPGCECASVPVANSLIRRGVAPAAAFTFLLAAPAINPVVLISTAVAFQGDLTVVLARFCASLTVAVTVGWLWMALGRKVHLRLLKRSDPPAHRGMAMVESVQHDFLHAAGYLVLGSMIAAGVNTFVPPEWVDSTADEILLSIVVLGLFAFVVAMCSEADAFVAASLTAFSPTAQLAFMVVGPAADIKIAAMNTGYFGRSFAAVFTPLTLGVALTSAGLFGWWLL